MRLLPAVDVDAALSSIDHHNTMIMILLCGLSVMCMRLDLFPCTFRRTLSMEMEHLWFLIDFRGHYVTLARVIALLMNWSWFIRIQSDFFSCQHKLIGKFFFSNLLIHCWKSVSINFFFFLNMWKTLSI